MMDESMMYKYASVYDDTFVQMQLFCKICTVIVQSFMAHDKSCMFLYRAAAGAVAIVLNIIPILDAPYTSNRY